MTTDELPDGWCLTPVGEIAAISSGKYIKRGEYSDTPSRPYPVAGAAGPIGWCDQFNTPPPILTLGRVGSAGALNTYQTACWVTDNALIVQPQHPDWLTWLAHFFQGIKWSDIATGSSQPLVTQTQVKALELPLPPLAEQRRIVAAVERILDRVNTARARLDRVPTTLKRFRQAVLAAACSGQLTADWRGENQSVKHDTDAVASTDPNEQGAENDETPTTWRIADIARVSEAIADCPHSTPKWTDSGEICLRTTNFQPGWLDLSEVRFVSSETYTVRIRRIEPKPGDIVYSREGGILGIACQVPDDLRACLGQRMMLMRVWHWMSGTFVMHVLNSPATTAIVEEMTGGTASPHLNVGDVKAFRIPVPPLAEQQEIVKRVSALFARADAIEAAVTAGRKRVDTLTQTVLAKAFRGELVPTEAELARRKNRPYEPAADLLARIRAANEATPAKQTGRRKATRPNDAAVDVLTFAAVTATDAGSLNRTKAIKFAAVLQEHHGVAVVERFLQGQYGPYSPEIEAAEPECEKRGYFTVQKTPKEKGGFEVQFSPGPKADAGRQAALNRLGENADAAERLLRTIRGMTTDEAELFATVYTVWKELLLAGKPADEKTITAGVYGWHEEKKKFTPDAIRHRMAWMREAGYVPNDTDLRDMPTTRQPVKKRASKPRTAPAE